MPKHVAPTFSATDFSCPYCQAHAAQLWYQLFGNVMSSAAGILEETTSAARFLQAQQLDTKSARKALKGAARAVETTGVALVEHGHIGTEVEVFKNVAASRCFSCDSVMLWHDDRPLFPAVTVAPPAHEDMPDRLRAGYKEAADIAGRSPRGASAILRLLLQQLCVHLGGKGKHISTDIQTLVDRGLPQKVQQALDAVRVTSNDAVHLGELLAEDDIETVLTLFKLINVIVQRMITDDKLVEDAWDAVPESKKREVEQRDAKAKAEIERNKPKR